MKPGLRILLIGVVVVILGYLAYSRRFEMSAAVWHWKNGDFTRIRNYEVPVPVHWLVKAQPPGGLLLVDTRPHRTTAVLPGINVIAIDSPTTPIRDLLIGA